MDKHLRQHGGFLHHGAPGRQVAEQHGQPAGGAVGPIERPDDLVVAHRRRALILGRQVDAGDGRDRAVDEPGLAQPVQDGHDPARPVKVLHVLGARGRQLDQVGCAVGNLVEGLKLELDAGLVGDGHEVQHRVGRAAQRGVHGQRVARGWPRVRNRRAVQPFRTTSTAAAPVCRARISRAENGAGMVASPGSARPRVSVTQPIELAVNSPAQEPQVGQTAVFELAQLVRR